MLGLSSCLTSCNDYLDKLPDQRMELKSPSEVSRLLVSAYPEIHPAYLLEMYSDNADEIVGTSWSEASKFQGQAYRWEDITETSDNESPQRVWQAGFAAVNTANEALQYINKVSNPEDYTAQKGEALLCRAYAMFSLSTVFCRAYDSTTADNDLGLYYPEEANEEVKAHHERGTLAELYAKIDADLKEGISLVSNTYDHPKFHFTQTSAAAFAARFYLYYQKYDEAIKYANSALGASPTLRDWASWAKLSANGVIQPNAYISSNEKSNLLLQVVYSAWGAIGGPTTLGCRYAHGQLISRRETMQSSGPWGVSDDVFNYTVWYNNSISKYIFRKIPYVFEYTDIQAGVGYAHSEYSVFNTDLLLLERAEAYALRGDYAKAVADINTELKAFSNNGVQITLEKIKEFYGNNRLAYSTPYLATARKQMHTSFALDMTTQEPLLQCILHLKRILTLHEGIRMQDIKRYGITIYRRTLVNDTEVESVTDTMTADDPRQAVQLPADVITAGVQANPRNK